MAFSIDRLLNNVTMYRLLAYALGVFSAAGVALGFFGQMSVSGWAMLGSLAILCIACIGSNRLFSRIMGAAENAESSLITALILFLILFPADTVGGYALIAFAGILATASKYLLTISNRHVLNPAAVGAVAIGLMGWGSGWWVANAYLFPVVLIGGLLVARKTRRVLVVVVFTFAAFVSIYVSSRMAGIDLSVADLVSRGLFSWPIVFFGTIMLTEPLSLPPSRSWQVVEAALLGLAFALSFQIGPVHSTPALILLLGNLFALADGIKRTYRLRFVEKLELAPGIYDYLFSSDRPVRFVPGQYIETTLPAVQSDARGNRRTFSISSSPGDALVRLGIRMPERPSGYKRALQVMKPGDLLIGSNVGGEFVLPKDPRVKLAFIAGGIGITPFRSMLQDMMDRKEARDVVLFYACKASSDFVYRDVFDKASGIGLRVSYVATDRDGRLAKEDITAKAPDCRERHFYLSGPNAMVDSYRTLLRGMGVPSRNIHTDYFPGY